jgi:hypothetical protein
MPYNSFQKLSTSKLSGANSILPFQPHITSGNFGGGQVYATRSGFNKVTLGVYPSGGPGTSQHSRLKVYRSTDGGNNYSYYSGILFGATGVGHNFTDTGLTTGTTYFYKFGFSGSIGGVSYETTGSGFGISTKTPVIATGGDYVYGDGSLWTAWTNNKFSKYHVYKKSANFVVANGGSGLDPQEKLHVFLVGGGGGGGKNFGGGGGGGGLSHITGLSVTSNTTYTITVAAGGGQNAGGGSSNGNNGGHSSAFNYTGYGGGGGGGQDTNGNTGGCGGGAGHHINNIDGHGGSGFSGSNATGLSFLGWTNATHNTGRYNFQGFSGGRPYYVDNGAGAGGGGGGTYQSGSPAGSNLFSINRATGGEGWAMENATNYSIYNSNYGYATLYYDWVSKALTSGGATVRLGAGGGGGGTNVGKGGTNAGNGSADWGENYYAYPAGLGGSGTYYGAAGGGGGRGGGGGGAGYSGVVIIAYVTGDYDTPTAN